MLNNYPDIDLTEIIIKLREFKLIDLNKFDSFLADIIDYLYETAENINNSNLEVNEMVIEKLKIIKPQIIQLNRTLERIMYNYECKYMHRLISMTYSLEKDIIGKLNSLDR